MYDFVPDLFPSTSQNAQRVLGDTSTSTYFEPPHNIKFHDLTPGRQLPPVTKLVLGLYLKFVLRPEAPTTQKSAMEAF